MINPSIIYILALMIGLVVIVKSGDYFVNSSARLSRLTGLSELFVGLVIVSIATSFPEFSVSFLSALEHEMDVSLGNAFGTTIANICLGFGLALLVRKKLPTDKDTIYNCVFMLFTVILCLVYAIRGYTSRLDGILMILIFGAYLYFIFKKRHDKLLNREIRQEVDRRHLLMSIFGIVVGLAGIFISAKIIIWSIINIAIVFGISKHLISATVVAVGTSIPEIVSSILAMYRKYYGISIGTIIGSNIIDILLTIGISSLFVNVWFPSISLELDIPFYLILSIILLIFIHTGKTLSRKEGLILLNIYIIYLYLLIKIF